MVGIIDVFALILNLAMVSVARAMAMVTEMVKAMDGERNGNAKAVIVDGSGGQWRPWQ
jgi:hypothetical protein